MERPKRPKKKCENRAQQRRCGFGNVCLRCWASFNNALQSSPLFRSCFSMNGAWFLFLHLSFTVVVFFLRLIMPFDSCLLCRLAALSLSLSLSLSEVNCLGVSSFFLRHDSSLIFPTAQQHYQRRSLLLAIQSYRRHTEYRNIWGKGARRFALLFIYTLQDRECLMFYVC